MQKRRGGERERQGDEAARHDAPISCTPSSISTSSTDTTLPRLSASIWRAASMPIPTPSAAPHTFCSSLTAPSATRSPVSGLELPASASVASHLGPAAAMSMAPNGAVRRMENMPAVYTRLLSSRKCVSGAPGSSLSAALPRGHDDDVSRAHALTGCKGQRAPGLCCCRSIYPCNLEGVARELMRARQGSQRCACPRSRPADG